MIRVFFIKQNNYNNIINIDCNSKEFINDKKLFDYIDKFNRSEKYRYRETIVDFKIINK